MKGPSDQAKLLFLGLLRTVSALATEHKIGTTLAYNTAATVSGPITLRVARQTDVPSIQRCNLATLPENYNPQFYVNHLRAWPELALVAESCSPNDQEKYGNYYSPFRSHPEPNVVAYVLGKVEDRQVDIGVDDMMTDEYGIPQHRYVTEKIGHVTSLAVLPSARRQGIAQDLMDQLHWQLQSLYRVNCVSLHVRQSNFAAGKLYRGQGYVAVEQIPKYYQDGEDAYFMKKNLGVMNNGHHVQQSQYQHQPTQQQYTASRPWHEQRPTRFFGSLRRQHSPQQQQQQQRQATPPHLLLPRPIGRDLSVPSQELLTGTM